MAKLDPEAKFVAGMILVGTKLGLELSKQLFTALGRRDGCCVKLLSKDGKCECFLCRVDERIKKLEEK